MPPTKDRACGLICVKVGSVANGMPWAWHSAVTAAASGPVRNVLLKLQGSEYCGKFSCWGRNSSLMLGARVARLYEPRTFRDSIGFHCSAAL